MYCALICGCGFIMVVVGDFCDCVLMVGTGYGRRGLCIIAECVWDICVRLCSLGVLAVVENDRLGLFVVSL